MVRSINITIFLSLLVMSPVRASFTVLSEKMDFSNDQLSRLQDVLESFTNNSTRSNSSKSLPVKRTWLTKSETIDLLLKPSEIYYFLGTPNFSYTSSQKLMLKGALKANIKVAKFSAGLDVSLSKVVTTTLNVQYFDPNSNYANYNELQNATLYKDGSINHDIEQNLSKTDKENFWKNRKMVFSCFIEAQLDLSDRQDLSIGIGADDASMSAGFERHKDNIIKSSFVTATVPVPLGFANSVNDRTHGTLITSFSVLSDICQNSISKKVSDLLDANLKADLASKVFQSDLTTCESDRDCYDANDHWFVQWLLKVQHRSYLCEERSDLPGVKTCVKRGLIGSSCSNKKSSGAVPCQKGLECYSPDVRPYAYGAYYGYVPFNSGITYGLGTCRKKP